MKVAGHNRVTDGPKLGPSLLIATALVVAIRTARWAAKQPSDALCSDVDQELDREISFAIRMTGRVLGALLRNRQGLFPTRLEPFYEDGCEEDVLKWPLFRAQIVWRVTCPVEPFRSILLYSSTTERDE